mgnify:CR=1 FL=1
MSWSYNGGGKSHEICVRVRVMTSYKVRVMTSYKVRVMTSYKIRCVK